jgi:hypothetical protein
VQERYTVSSQAVVDDLEAVEVDKQNCELIIGVFPLTRDGAPETVKKHRPIGQLRQVVMESAMDEPILGTLALNDATELGSHLRHQALEQLVEWRDAIGEELEDRHHLASRQHWKRKCRL